MQWLHLGDSTTTCCCTQSKKACPTVFLGQSPPGKANSDLRETGRRVNRSPTIGKSHYWTRRPYTVLQSGLGISPTLYDKKRAMYNASANMSLCLKLSGSNTSVLYGCRPFTRVLPRLPPGSENTLFPCSLSAEPAQHIACSRLGDPVAAGLSLLPQILQTVAAVNIRCKALPSTSASMTFLSLRKPSRSVDAQTKCEPRTLLCGRLTPRFEIAVLRG